MCCSLRVWLYFTLGKWLETFSGQDFFVSGIVECRMSAVLSPINRARVWEFIGAAGSCRELRPLRVCPRVCVPDSSMVHKVAEINFFFFEIRKKVLGSGV